MVENVAFWIAKIYNVAGDALSPPLIPQLTNPQL